MKPSLLKAIEGVLTMRKMDIRQTKQLLLVVLGLWAAMVLIPSTALAQLDIYVVYAGNAKVEKDRLIKSLSPSLSVKTYNADLLALADYSGKQKAVAKLQTAKVVVVLQDDPIRMLEGSSLSVPLMVVESTQQTVTSERQVIYVVPLGMDVSGLGGKTLEVKTDGDLVSSQAVLHARVVVVDPSVEFFEAVSRVAEKVLGL